MADTKFDLVWLPPTLKADQKKTYKEWRLDGSHTGKGSYGCGKLDVIQYNWKGTSIDLPEEKVPDYAQSEPNMHIRLVPHKKVRSGKLPKFKDWEREELGKIKISILPAAALPPAYSEPEPPSEWVNCKKLVNSLGNEDVFRKYGRWISARRASKPDYLILRLGGPEGDIRDLEVQYARFEQYEGKDTLTNVSGGLNNPSIKKTDSLLKVFPSCTTIYLNLDEIKKALA